MPVLVEGVSVIVRLEAIRAQMKDGMDGFLRLVPNGTYCVDQDLARVGFMTPQDVQDFVGKLTQHGLVFVRDGRAVDLVVVDQVGGPTSECPWVEFLRAIDSKSGSEVVCCRFIGNASTDVATPRGWLHERSLSSKISFTPNERIKEELRFLRREGSLDVYVDLTTGKEVYVGRTSHDRA